MTLKKHISCRYGFTLMEILVAILIFSILFIVLFGSFRFIATSSDNLGYGTLQIEMGQQCMSRIASDIESIFVSQPPIYKQPELRENKDPHCIEGVVEDVDGNSFSRLRFTSLSHFSFGSVLNSGVAEIVYYVHRYRGNEYVLRRSDTLYPFEEFEKKNTDPIVCKNIQGFSVTYYDDAGEESGEWDSEEGEYEYATPHSIQIHLEIGKGNSPMVFTNRIYIPAYREKLESS